jgi:tRNA modification GTPase
MSLPHSDDQRKTNPPPNRPADQCALLTGPGRSAIAVIGLQGPSAALIVASCFDSASPSELRPGQVRYGSWTGPGDGETAGESVVVTPIADDRFEIHCHGGPAAIERIIGDLQDSGAIRVEISAWSAPQNRLVGEARDVLARCLTARTAAIAMDQVRGAMVDWVARWIDAIGAGQSIDGLTLEATNIGSHAPITTRLADPFRVVLIGPPNVGKSSLVNAIVGYDRSITFDQAGTTRDVLHADTVIDGLPIRLSDTAGIRESDESIEQQGIARAMAAAGGADLILSVHSPESDLRAAVSELSGPLTQSANPILAVFNKIDLLDRDNQAPADAYSTNALSGDGIPELLEAVARQLGRSMPKAGQPVPINERQAACLSELVQASDQNESLRILRKLLGEDE